MDIKKVVLAGAVVLIIAVLLLPQSPVKIMGLAQPIGIVGYVKRTNNAPVIGATVTVLDKTVKTDAKGRYVTNGAAEAGASITVNAANNGLGGSIAFTVDLSKSTQWANITIGQVNANFIYSPSNPQPNQTVTFTDTSSGNIVKWEWTFGNLPVVTFQKNPTNFYTTEGTYTIIHTVTDDLGVVKSVSKNIVVKNPVRTYLLTIRTKPFGCFVTVCKSFILPTGANDLSCQPPKNSGENGTLAYGTLSSGDYTLSVGKEGYLYKTMTVHLTSDQMVVVDLTPQAASQTPEIGMYIFIGAFIASLFLLFVTIARKKKK